MVTVGQDPVSSPSHGIERRRIRVTGTVQGVGFRPFVYRTARALGLSGSVGNDAAGVVVEVEGAVASLDRLVHALAQDPPPLARIETVSVTTGPVLGVTGFEVVGSQEGGGLDVPVSVDVGPCDACLAEVLDPADRRYRYPLLNCTDCGPRYTITRGIPYDRAATTMAPFPMCDACRTEYEDPADRRFHAQPNACATCGPQLRLTASDGRALAAGGDALEEAVRRLREGEIVAVRGVGGFHLATPADDGAAVTELRRRKRRDDKPFALLVADVAAARTLVDLDDVAAGLLAGHRRPIVLAPRRADAPVADGVAPGLHELGVMLPPSPLHALLAADLARPLVLTSGNLSDEPIAYRDRDAYERLGPLVDAVLTHDREIHIRCDDSVLRASVVGGTQPIRRSRGYAPEPLRLPAGSTRRVLAVGAELKSTIAVTRAGTAVLSHHLGDLEHPATHEAFLQAIGHLLDLHGIEPEVVAHDLHPEYLSTKLAIDLELPRRGVQHHHAHVASCLAEHGVVDQVVGIAFDGLGWGTDGTAWGGEVLVCDLDGFERVGHLAPVGLPGGAAAVREPWRMAVSWAVHALEEGDLAAAVGTLDGRWEAVASLATSDRTLVTTSAGRLFDAVAALLGLRSAVTYEGQAAIELEALARSVPTPSGDELASTWRAGDPVVVRMERGMRVMDPAELIRTLVRARGRGVPRAELAAWFHEVVAGAVVEVAVAVAEERGLGTVALSGGVFQNLRLTRLVASLVEAAGLRVLVHRTVPPNDGGISLGQAAIASIGAVA
jgi:hydrogenase maturation protein HypF